MATFINEPSHTFNEYLLIPGYSSADCIPSNVSLKTPLVRFQKGEKPAITMNIPMVSAIMQAVSGDRLAIALAKEGGVSFIYGSQSIESEAAMVARVKSYKAGFVGSDSNLRPDQTLADILALKEATGHSTVAVTDDGSSSGKLCGIVTGRDYRVSRMAPTTPIYSFMTPIDRLITAPEGTTLKEANDIIWEHKLNSLPIVSADGRLLYFVFRKDYTQHKENPDELLDASKRYVVGAGINTRDYAQRVPALVEAGADVCSDGGIVYDHHITLALAIGADFVMLGRYFARFDESPSDKIYINGTMMKEYWGEGSNRARNWQRYDLGGSAKLSFEEGVDSYVPYAGKLSDNVQQSLAKARSTMCNCGALSIPELQQKAKLTLVSSVSIVEGGAHDVVLKTAHKQI